MFCECVKRMSIRALTTCEHLHQRLFLAGQAAKLKILETAWPSENSKIDFLV